MFSVRNVPVVIEPGVGALEAVFFVSDNKLGNRTFPLQLQRIDLSSDMAEKLPFIPSTRFPHAFTLVTDIDKSAVIVIYDMVGRLSVVYTRGAKDAAWERCDVADEHAGKTVTQFSVRFNFGSLKERTSFLDAIESMIKDAKGGRVPDSKTVMRAMTSLGRSRAAPVVLPVAVARAHMKPVKL
jgi:hypothetical protein